LGKHPSLSTAADALPLSIFQRLYERLARFPGGEVVPLHIGDTCLAPPVPARLGNLGFGSDGQVDLYRYAPPAGDGALVEALVAKLRAENRLAFAAADSVQITCGATHALSTSLRAILDPGDEILLLSPYWPLIRGIALSVSARPVDLPFSQRLLREPGLDPEALIEERVGPRTRALYMCNPNNPDGKVYSEAELAAIARVAERHGLWVLSDEAYEHFVYDGRRHVSIASLPGMAARTLTVFTFSKSFAQAGLRVGYVCGPVDAVAAVRKMVNHTVYGVPRAMQAAALAALTGGRGFLDEARQRYQAARDLALSKVAAPCVAPQGGTYLFLDLGEWIGEGDSCALISLDGPSVLERLAEAGVLLAPGSSFGEGCGRWARLCFSAVPEPLLVEGIERMNRVLAAMATPTAR
jgi:aspartate/methionine/tyrosine aminotransferase